MRLAHPLAFGRVVIGSRRVAVVGRHHAEESVHRAGQKGGRRASCHLEAGPSPLAVAGPVQTVQAHVVSHPPAPEPVDSLTVFLEFASRVTGVLCGVRTTPAYWRVHVFGKEGSAEAIGGTELTLRKTDAVPQRFTFEPRDTLRLELEAFADAASGGAPYHIPPQQMIDAVAALEATIESMNSGGKIRVRR